MTAAKVVVTGPVCAGKTSFVHALSRQDAHSTEAPSTSAIGKENTTVGMDVGATQIEGRSVKLFGTPGQERFAYMWEILAAGADGVVLLIPADREQAIGAAEQITEVLTAASPPPVGVGVTRSDRADGSILPAVQRRFEDRAAFVERLDGRVPDQCRALLAALMDEIEAGRG